MIIMHSVCIIDHFGSPNLFGRVLDSRNLDLLDCQISHAVMEFPFQVVAASLWVGVEIWGR